MGLIEDIPRAHEALAWARRGEAERIALAVTESQVVGLLGEAEVGKTEMIRQALTKAPDEHVLRLDLDGAASPEHVGFLLAKQLARAAVGETNLSLSVGGSLRSSAAELARAELVDLLGWEGFEEALRSWPSGRFSLEGAFDALEQFAQRDEVLLWIDHLESPLLTPRHPLSLDKLLWGVRDLTQRHPALRVVLSGREAVSRQVLGPKSAFHQQGRWLAMGNPDPGTWGEVARRMEVSPGVAEHLGEMTGGHPSTMLLGLIDLVNRQRLPPAYDVLQDLAAQDDGLAARAMQHARSLHRLGSQLMTQIAAGERPYAMAQRGKTSSQEIRKVLDRLRLAGLVRKGERWEIVNPLIALRLRGTMRVSTAPEVADEPPQSYE